MTPITSPFFIPVETTISAPERGAIFLDEHHPGWATRIDLATFMISNGRQCVCGQVFAHEARLDDYGTDGFNHLSDQLGEPVMIFYGFTLPRGGAYQPERAGRWDTLQAEWIKLIRTRQEAA